MIFTIDTQKETDSNIVGEYFRKYAFDGEGLGCYSNFDLKDSFERHNPPLHVVELLVGKAPNSYPSSFPSQSLDEWQKEWEQDIKSINYFKDTASDLEVAWYWDGDGTLYFKEGKVEVINDDCKKDYIWEFVNENRV